MTAVASSVPPSLASEYTPTNAWLAQDVTDPTGKGPVTTGPVEPVGSAVNGTAPVALNPSPLPWGEAELAVQPPDYFPASAAPHEGPWPAVPQDPAGKEPLGTLPPEAAVPAGYYRVPPEVEGLSQVKAYLPGHDAHSQDTDTAGWDQYTPSGRTAIRQGWVQHYPGVDNWWPVTQPNLARVRTAMGGNQDVGGVVAEYGGLFSSGGNQAYETPQPPAVSPAPSPAAAAGTIPQWGF